MKRFRLSTLMLLVVIAALTIALVVQEQRYRHQLARLGAGRKAVTVNSQQRFDFLPIAVPSKGR